MSKINILLIDDDFNLRKTLSDMLRAKGYEVYAAKDVTEGLALLKWNNIHRKLIRRLREALGKIKTLREFIPICVSCKKARDDKGYWSQAEAYVEETHWRSSATTLVRTVQKTR